MNTDWHDLIQRHSAGLTTEEEAALLHDTLKQDDAVARLYLRHMNLDVALEAHAGATEAMKEMLIAADAAPQSRATRWLSWRPLAAAAAGIVIGCFSASIVWAISSPNSTTERLSSLINGSFDDHRLERGFPLETGVWGGDEAAVSHGKLCFVAPESDSSAPGRLLRNVRPTTRRRHPPLCCLDLFTRHDGRWCLWVVPTLSIVRGSRYRAGAACATS